jgi:hypothetical protein
VCKVALSIKQIYVLTNPSPPIALDANFNQK